MTDLQKQAAEVVGRLTDRQRDYALDRYDDDFVSHEDAAALEREGVWQALPPDDEDEFWRFGSTPLGLAVRALLQDNPHARDNEEMSDG